MGLIKWFKVSPYTVYAILLAKIANDMSALSMIRIGNPILRERSGNVSKKELKTQSFQKFLDDLAEMCIKNNGVGIAAPQVGVSKRVIIVHVDPKNPRYRKKEPFPLTVVINPKVMWCNKQKHEDWEGDLSADIRALVPRPVACIVKGFNRKGEKVTYDLQYEFHARVFQHEIDHLNGILFVDRVKNTKSYTEYEEWKKYWKDK